MYLYLRTSSKTKYRHLGLLQSLLSFNSSSIIRLPRGLVSIGTTRGAKCLCVLCSHQEVSLCLVSQVTLRSSTLASSIVCLAKSHTFHHITHCLSQAYGCSDHYRHGREALEPIQDAGGAGTPCLCLRPCPPGLRKGCECYDRTSLTYADTSDCIIFSFLTSLHRSPCMILSD